MRTAFIAVTTACLGFAALYTVSRARVSADDRRRARHERIRRGKGILALFLTDRGYRREWFAELRNVYRRMEILRRRKLLRHGICLTTHEERLHTKYEGSRDFERARIRSMQALKTIHPAATLVDHYLVMSVIGPDLFAEGWDTAAVSVRGRIRM